MDKPLPLADDQLFRHSVISPLRYPGAKRQLVPVIEELIAANIPPPRLLVEPFCGGATATLRLLGSGAVEHGVLADVDPLVASFWKTAAFDARWLIDAMRELSITVEEWDRWRAAAPRTRRDRALKCLFLNRTTFSGILHGRAGPIGGRTQASAYKIDCRFGIEGLTRRINGVADLAATGRLLDVWQCDWRSALARIPKKFGALDDSEVVVYLDPPYVEKAPWLYEWSFESTEHAKLAATLRSDLPYRWLLSYDDTPTVRKLYDGADNHTTLHVSYRYTAAGSEKRTVKDELLVTNLTFIPKSDRYRVLGS
ncbi:DNA adenine methylase [Streptosporangium sandarakinum]|uniref:DNA adenine methylase n=1 Tax=Streptosporangium sandarakinum TaxID=1260955 RepID=A0A852UUF5_9ACTN|nr:DNA adenine methylase [Streptosporangium sandarakinum]NYF40932.1 DNA adenine methylase [Streptosporangium sandarakinum]